MGTTICCRGVNVWLPGEAFGAFEGDKDEAGIERRSEGVDVIRGTLVGGEVIDLRGEACCSHFNQRQFSMLRDEDREYDSTLTGVTTGVGIDRDDDVAVALRSARVVFDLALPNGSSSSSGVAVLRVAPVGIIRLRGTGFGFDFKRVAFN